MIKFYIKKRYSCHAYYPLGHMIKKNMNIKDIKILYENFNLNNYNFIIIVNDHPKFFEIPKLN